MATPAKKRLLYYPVVRGRVIQAAHLFRRRQKVIKSLRQRRIFSTRASLALLSKPFLYRRGAVVPLVRRSLIDTRRVGELVQPSRREVGKRSKVNVRSRVSVPRESAVLDKAVARRILPTPFAYAYWKASVCREREERRQVLFAKRGAGSGISNKGPRKFELKSKVRC